MTRLLLWKRRPTQRKFYCTGNHIQGSLLGARCQSCTLRGIMATNVLMTAHSVLCFLVNTYNISQFAQISRITFHQRRHFTGLISLINIYILTNIFYAFIQTYPSFCFILFLAFECWDTSPIQLRHHKMKKTRHIKTNQC